MLRIAAMLAGLVLIGLPAWFLSGLVPLPQYRKGGWADYLPMLQQLLAIYGSVLLGVAIYFMRLKLSGQPAFPFELFKAGMYGVLACCIDTIATRVTRGAHHGSASVTKRATQAQRIDGRQLPYSIA